MRSDRILHELIRKFLAGITFSILTSTILLAQSNENKFIIEGFILYPSTDTIPQDVIIFPSRLDELNDELTGYWVYFQGMRWTQKDLLETLRSARTYEVEMEGITFPEVGFIGPGIIKSIVKPGRIVFNSTYSNRIEMDASQEIYLVRLLIENKIYNLRYMEALKEFGLPKYFEIIQD